MAWPGLLCISGAVAALQAQSPGLLPTQGLPGPRTERRVEAPAPEPIRPAALAAPAPATSSGTITNAAGDYVLAPADTVEMNIFREADLTTRSRVASDGTVQLPLIGDVKVAGMTIRAARELIRRRYDADYLVDPQVYLNVVDYAPRKFTILGQITKPGTYEFPGGGTVSLLQAVGLAGGFTRTADRGKIIVKRQAKSGAEETFKLNAKKIAAEGRNSFEITSGDVINVGESWF